MNFAAGLVGGAALIGLSYWAISGMVAATAQTGENGQNRPVSRLFVLVKFFTRHAILAAAGYGMMVRLHLDPIAMMVGVTAAVMAIALSAARQR